MGRSFASVCRQYTKSPRRIQAAEVWRQRLSGGVYGAASSSAAAVRQYMRVRRRQRRVGVGSPLFVDI